MEKASFPPVIVIWLPLHGHGLLSRKEVGHISHALTHGVHVSSDPGVLVPFLFLGSREDWICNAEYSEEDVNKLSP